VCGMRDRDEISCSDSATGSVTEDEAAARIVDALEMRPRRAERSVDVERLHQVMLPRRFSQGGAAR
jgi:hypothetical protein